VQCAVPTLSTLPTEDDVVVIAAMRILEKRRVLESSPFPPPKSLNNSEVAPLTPKTTVVQQPSNSPLRSNTESASKLTDKAPCPNSPLKGKENDDNNVPRDGNNVTTPARSNKRSEHPTSDDRASKKPKTEAKKHHASTIIKQHKRTWIVPVNTANKDPEQNPEQNPEYIEAIVYGKDKSIIYYYKPSDKENLEKFKEIPLQFKKGKKWDKFYFIVDNVKYTWSQFNNLGISS